MSLFGVGTDLIEIDRIQQTLDNNEKIFIRRIAHPCELKTQPGSKARFAQYWASRFAAKEAFSKALGTGIGKSLSWKDVGVAKNKTGRPVLAFSSRLSRQLSKKGITHCHLSLTHTAEHAMAFVILEHKKGTRK